MIKIVRRMDKTGWILCWLNKQLCFFNYWKGVSAVSSYMQNFLEPVKNCPFHWETRHRKFSKELYNNVKY